MELITPTENSSEVRDVLDYASNLPYSTSASANRILGLPIDLRFGGSCLDQALVVQDYLPGRASIIWDRNKGHFANLVDGRYFDPTYHQDGLEMDPAGFYHTSAGKIIKAKVEGSIADVKIYPEGQEFKKGFFRKNPDPEYSFSMQYVHYPLELASCMILGRFSMEGLPKPLINHNFDPSGLVTLKYNPEIDDIEAYMNPYGVVKSKVDLDLESAIAQYYHYMGVDYYDILIHFRSVWEMKDEVVHTIRSDNRYSYY